MKKIKLLTLLFTALLVSGSVWGQSVPNALDVPNLNFEKIYLDGKPDKKQVANLLSTKYPESHLIGERQTPTRKIAQSVVAYIGETSYDSWASAIADASDGDTIRLNQSLSQPISIDKNIVLDLNGKYIYSKTSWYVIYTDANVTIMNGYVYTYADTYYSEGGTEVADSETYAIFANSGSVNLTNVFVSGTNGYPYNAVYVNSGAVAEATNSAFYGADAAVCVVGEFTALGSTAIYGADGIDVFGAGAVTLDDSVYAYGYYYGMYVSSSGDINIGGGAVLETDKYYALYLTGSNNVTIDENAKIQYNGSYLAIYVTGSGTTLNIKDNAHIISPNRICLCQLDAGVINVYSGTLETVGRCIQGSSPINVYGGYFKASRFKSDGVTPMNAIEAVGNKTIIGGTFVNKVVAVTTGYDYYDNGDDTYTVKKIVARIVGSDVNYFSITDAVNAATEGEEIILVADQTEDLVISKTITLNTNDKTLTGTLTATGDAVVTLNEMGVITGKMSVSDNGQIIAYKGKFIEDPTEFVPEESTVKYDNPYYVVTRAAVRVEGVDYLTFAEAIAAAEALSVTNPTVQLLADAKIRSDIQQNISKDMIIDLNNHSLFAVNSKLSFLSFATSNTTVTIKNGTITNAPSSSECPLALIQQGGANTIHLENVTVKNNGAAAILTMKAAAAISTDAACSLSGSSCAVRMAANATFTNSAQNIKVCIQENPTTIVNNSGASIILTTEGVYSSILTLTNSGSIEVNGGIYGEEFEISTSSLGSFIVRKGVFFPTPKSVLNDNIASDMLWNEIKYRGSAAWNTYASGATKIATIDGLSYYDLSDALAAIADDKTEKTIVLESNIDVEVTSDAVYTIAENQYIKLDLNGKKINATNTSKAGGLAVVFNIVKNSKLTIEDTSLEKTGIITYKNTCGGGWLVYTINCEGTLIVNGGTIENTSSLGATPYAIELGKAGKLTINDGLVRGYTSLAIRYWADVSSSTVLNLNGGEIRGKKRAVWIQLPGSDSSSCPYAEFNMTGGKLTCDNEGEEAFYAYSYGESLSNIKINVSGGTIDGGFSIGGGSHNGGNDNEIVSISGGTFITTNAFRSFKRGIEQHVISGGAYFFDMNKSTNADYIKLCEYIKQGHYALKMCRDDEKGTYANDKIEGKYVKCEGEDCGDGTFWAVIDGEGVVEPQEPTTSGTWSDGDKGGVFDGKVPDEKTDVTISTIVTIPSDTVAKANKLVLDEGAGIRIKYDATLEVGLGGIEINGDGTGTTYIIVEPGGTLKANGTVVSSSVKEIIVEANADTTGIVLFDPALDYNNQPKSTVQMYTYARHIPAQDKYIWQHFGIPTLEAPGITWDRDCAVQFWHWNYSLSDWEQVKYKNNEVNTPFRGYNIKTNYEGTNGVTFTFTGNILGNGDASFNLVPGFNFYANSYLAPINATTLIEDMDDENVEWTVWMYDGQKDNFDIMNEASLIFGENTDIPAMRGFFLRLTSGNGGASGINYENAVWGNAISKKSSAPLRKTENNGLSMVKISMTAVNGQSDNVYLMEGNQFNTSFDNGYDATKLMSEEGANLYAETMNGNLTSIASSDLDGQFLSIETKDQSEYTLTFSHQNGVIYTLVDTDNNNEVKMEEGATYTFEARPNATISNRFQIRKIAEVATGVDELSNIMAENAVYTVLGRYVGKTSEWSKLPAGVYVVNGVKVVK